MFDKLIPDDFPIQDTFTSFEMPDPRDIFAGVNTGAPIIVAVSGGSDSMALLLLAAAWAQSSAQGRNAKLQVVTVDHGLRPEAAAEAAYVASVCERLELMHVTLAWEGIKPISGISDAAREARYHLLEEFAADTGANTILTGHTADDQAETISMRLKRDMPGNSGRGLAGMARVTRLPGGTKLIRPLLGLRRQMLRDYLADCSQSWIEDPSNQDPSYERVRTRLTLADNPLQVERLVRFGGVMARFREHQAKEAARVLVTNTRIKPGPVYEFRIDDLAMVPPPVVTHALQVLVALAGGGDHLVPLWKFSNLALAVRNGTAAHDGKYRLTLGRCVVEVEENRFLFYREARNLPAILIGPGDEEVWDGRYRIINDSSSSLFVGPCDIRMLAEEERRRGEKLAVRPRSALKATPVLKADGDEIFYPMAERKSLPPRIYIKLTARALERFCPDWDRSLVDWVRDLELVGKDEFMGKSRN